MKNQTFAAYRHLPTGQIHILDLDLFSRQTMPDGATSLACEYFTEDGEKAFAVIASGEQDEQSATYIPLSEKENAEIMEAYVKCPIKIPANGWGDLKEVVGTFGEYKFAVNVNDPEHVLATAEFIELEEKPKTDLEKLLEYRIALYAVPAPELSDPELQDVLSEVASLLMSIGVRISRCSKS